MIARIKNKKPIQTKLKEINLRNQGITQLIDPR